MTATLYKDPVALDRHAHRALKVRRLENLAPAAGLSSLMVTLPEFADVAREYPIVFIDTGPDPATQAPTIAPVAVLGLQAEQNLYLDGEVWAARYVPAVLRRYPFAMAPAQDGQLVVVFDRAWPGVNAGEGEAMFDDQGEMTPWMKDMFEFLQNFERESQRTRMFCDLLQREGLLRDMRFDASTPGGEKLSVDGFKTIDTDKLSALPDAKVVELFRNGVLALIHQQHASLGLMRQMADRHFARVSAATSS